MELTFPEFPAEPGWQAAYAAALFLIVYGLALLAFPSTVGQLFGFAERENRPGAIGELRASGGMLSGFSLGVWIMSQPIPYVVLGTAVATSAFGRLISILSDKSFSFLNLLVFLAQIVIAFLLLSNAGSAFDGAGAFAVPTDPLLFVTFGVCLVLAAIGLVMMFAPGISLWITGLEATRDQAFAFVRSAGAFLFAAGGFAAFLQGMADSLFIAPLLIAFCLIFALAASSLGRVLALIFNRGNLVVNCVGLILQIAGGSIILWSIMSVI